MDDAKFFLRSALVERESKRVSQKKKGGAREARTSRGTVLVVLVQWQRILCTGYCVEAQWRAEKEWDGKDKGEGILRVPRWFVLRLGRSGYHTYHTT